MSSLYDKYYSEHNRTYMYNLIQNIIRKDYNIDIASNETYNQFFQTNFMNTFKSVDTEDIKDLNNHLLTTQLDYFQNFIYKETKLTKNEEDDLSETRDFIIHSLQRNINLQNSSRHNFRIKTPCKQNIIQVDKVILPIEESSLFMNPTILVSLDTFYIELHLRGTMNLRNREYGIYTPYFETQFKINSDICRIQIKNQMYHVKKDCDVYKIISTKDKKISLSCSSEEFKEGDYIRICNFENIEMEDESILKQQYKVSGIRNNEGTIELKLNTIIPECKDLYVMNLSLQNSIHLTSPE